MPQKKYIINFNRKKPYKGLSFMALPPEVRLMIYSYLKEPRVSNKPHPLFTRCPKERPHRYSKPSDRVNTERCRPSFTTPYTFPVSILTLNKTIFAEASDLFYKNMNWHYFVARTRDGYRTQPMHIDAAFMDYIEHITLNLIFSEPSSDCRTTCDLDVLCKTLAKLPALKKIDVRIHGPGPDLDNATDDRSFLACLTRLPKDCEWNMFSSRKKTMLAPSWSLAAGTMAVPPPFPRWKDEATVCCEYLEMMLDRKIGPVKVVVMPSFYPDWVKASI